MTHDQEHLTHDELVERVNVILAPIELQFSYVRPAPRRALVLSRQPRFDDDRSDAELSSLIRGALNSEANVAEATKNLDIVLK